MKQDIKSRTIEQLQEEFSLLSLPRFRAGQVYAWLHQKGARSFEEMTNLPKDLRAQLDGRYYINRLEVERRLVSKVDGTEKYLLRLGDGNCIEAVLMEYHHGNTLCISTQVGCRMGCKFCASTLGGLVRNLTASEMLDEVYTCLLYTSALQRVRRPAHPLAGRGHPARGGGAARPLPAGAGAAHGHGHHHAQVLP